MHIRIRNRMRSGQVSKKHLVQNVFLFCNAIGILSTVLPSVSPRLPLSIVLRALTVTCTVTLNRPYTPAIHLGHNPPVGKKRESAKAFAKIHIVLIENLIFKEIL